ncbi:unnamed protein product [Pleuronectes platessa]|uniref:Uncharacterized protein n=1 Tax=Pleuronectes platessa TaxID=8262 RepID=A0A9N7V597_PLEPL|nr:unnamed protein product [Pleuronectes platessa]
MKGNTSMNINQPGRGYIKDMLSNVCHQPGGSSPPAPVRTCPSPASPGSWSSNSRKKTSTGHLKCEDKHQKDPRHSPPANALSVAIGGILTTSRYRVSYPDCARAARIPSVHHSHSWMFAESSRGNPVLNMASSSDESAVTVE